MVNVPKNGDDNSIRNLSSVSKLQAVPSTLFDHSEPTLAFKIWFRTGWSPMTVRVFLDCSESLFAGIFTTGFRRSNCVLVFLFSVKVS